MLAPSLRRFEEVTLVLCLSSSPRRPRVVLALLVCVGVFSCELSVSCVALWRDTDTNILGENVKLSTCIVYLRHVNASA